MLLQQSVSKYPLQRFKLMLTFNIIVRYYIFANFQDSEENLRNLFLLLESNNSIKFLFVSGDNQMFRLSSHSFSNSRKYFLLNSDDGGGRRGGRIRYQLTTGTGRHWHNETSSETCIFVRSYRTNRQIFEKRFYIRETGAV